MTFRIFRDIIKLIRQCDLFLFDLAKLAADRVDLIHLLLHHILKDAV